MNSLTVIQKIAVWALPLLFAITVHEYAHGWAAHKLGDNTAKNLGRLSLNPIRHIDPLGTIVVPLLLMISSGFIFGWAKPVPVNWHNLRQPRRDMALVALAGPGSNLLRALLWGAVMKVGYLYAGGEPDPIALYLIYAGTAGIFINIILMVLNLLPIPPLDGSRVLSSLVSPDIARRLAQIEVYGFIILVVLLLTGILGQIISPPIFYIFKVIQSLYL